MASIFLVEKNGKCIFKLVCKNGGVITDQTEILKQELNFYSKLYHSFSTEQSQVDKFLPNNVNNNLSEDNHFLCDCSVEEK